MKTQDQFAPANVDFSNFQPKHFGWSLEGKVATITLNRPERKNPLTFDSYAELRDTFRNLTYADNVKTIVVTGAGGNFCSGGDVHEIIGPLVKMQEEGDMGGLLAFCRMTGGLVKAMRACPQPIIAAVDGICARPADQRIVAVAAAEQVVSRPAIQDVAQGVAVQHVVEIRAEHILDA